MQRCSEWFFRGLQLALLLSVAAIGACVERTRDTPKPQARPTARAAAPRAAQAPAPAAASTPAPAPSGPPVRLFAKRFVVKVREAPAEGAFRLGYLRGGAVMQATSAEPIGFDKCRKGWYELDTGGFVCATLDATPFSGTRLPEQQPLQADMLAPLPYPYGYSRRETRPCSGACPPTKKRRNTRTGACRPNADRLRTDPTRHRRLHRTTRSSVA